MPTLRHAETGLSATGSKRVSPYHSSNASESDVHHIYGDCPTGRKIPFANRRSGTNRWPLCKRCAADLGPLQSWPPYW